MRTIEPGNPMGPGDPAAPFSPVGPSKPYRMERNDGVNVKFCQGEKFGWNQLTFFNYLLDANLNLCVITDGRNAAHRMNL